MLPLVKVISINQPWAHFIVNGARGRDGKILFKDVENRTWATTYRGTILIHASKKPVTVTDELRDQLDRIGILLPADCEMKFGGIIGKADITKMLTDSNSPWFTGPFGWKLENAWPVTFRRVIGQQRIFNVPLEIYQSIGVDPYLKTYGQPTPEINQY